MNPGLLIARLFARPDPRSGGGCLVGGAPALAVGGCVLALLVAPASAEDDTARAHRIYNYIAGYQIAQRVIAELDKRQVTLDHDAIRSGVGDALGSGEAKYSQEEVLAAIQSIKAAQSERDNAAAAENLAEGKAFMAKNADKEGITVTDSGLQYEVLTAGTGARPDPESMVLVHYRGALLDGTEFDSSHKRGQPARFSPGGVIPGFREALLAMKQGAKWRVFIPSDLAYGKTGAGGAIGPNQTLIFELELLEVTEGQ